MNDFSTLEQLGLDEIDHEKTITAQQIISQQDSFPSIHRAISDENYWGSPEKCPLNHFLNVFKSDIAIITSNTTYGGPASKYKNINEDSYFFGSSQSNHIITGVIDGAGGSKNGYLGGKIANETLSSNLHQTANLKKAFSVADQNVILYANGGYATGVALTIDEKKTVSIASKGDARSLTLRHHNVLYEGTTLIQSLVAKKIETGELPPHAIHTSKNKNIIYSVIGNKLLPLYYTQFQAKSGDQIILGSDGLWDIVSDYEIQSLSKKFKGLELQTALFMLAYARNNSESPYELEFSEDELHPMTPGLVNHEKCRGDNITIQVIDVL